MDEKKIIDWEAAKKRSRIFMEYFGVRLTWPPMYEIIDANDNISDVPQNDYQENDNHDEIQDSSKNAEPNDIEWDI